MRSALLIALAALAAGCGTVAGVGTPGPAQGPISVATRSAAPAVAAPVVPDSLDGRYAVYTGAGAASSLDAVLAAAGDADVVFLGEEHDDATTHALQHYLLGAIHARYGGARPVALGMEMFERDAQLVLDEYLAGLIRERDFLAASRPWGNYATDYRPLVEYAREHGLAVLATNAPGRYVSLTSREGAAGLARLDAAARAFLPAFPVTPPSDALAAKFREQMGEMAGHTSPHGAAAPTLDGMLAAQNLRDAAMGEAVAAWLSAHRNALVVHVNGRFHSESGLGVPQHVARARRGTRMLSVTFSKSDDPTAAPSASPGDDFVIITLAPAEAGE